MSNLSNYVRLFNSRSDLTSFCHCGTFPALAAQGKQGSGSNEMVRVTQGILGLKRKKLIRYFYDYPDLVYAIQAKELNEIHEVYDFYLDRCGDPGPDPK